MVIHKKTPQSYAFDCFGESSGPMVFHVSHDQIGWWYVVNISPTSSLSALVYLRVFRAGLVLELWIVMVCEVKSKTIDHQ